MVLCLPSSALAEKSHRSLEEEMFKQSAFRAGLVCLVSVILSSLFGSWSIAAAFMLAGVLTVISHPRMDGIPMAIGVFVVAVGLGNMPMDGSWLLWGISLGFSLAFAFMSAASLYGSQAGTQWNWRDYAWITASLALPISGLSLVQYLVQTDRSVVSGLIVIAVLTWLARKVAPRTIVLRPAPRLYGNHDLPDVCNNPVGGNVDTRA